MKSKVTEGDILKVCSFEAENGFIIDAVVCTIEGEHYRIVTAEELIIFFGLDIAQ